MNEDTNSEGEINTSRSEKKETEESIFSNINLINTEEQAQKASIENIKNTSSKTPSKMAVDGTIGKKGTVELSQDCILGPEVAPAELLKEIVKIRPDKVLTPLLNTRTSCC